MLIKTYMYMYITPLPPHFLGVEVDGVRKPQLQDASKDPGPRFVSLIGSVYLKPKLKMHPQCLKRVA